MCSAIHPLALASPFLRGLPLREHGLEFAHPEIPLAHPLDDGTAVVLAPLARRDGRRPRRRRRRLPRAHASRSPPTGRRWSRTCSARCALPRHPLADARFARAALRSATGLARSRFAGARARALLAGNAAHSMRPLERPATARLRAGADAARPRRRLAAPRAAARRRSPTRSPRFCARSAARSRPAARSRSLTSCAGARAVLFDLTPRQILAIAGDRAAGALPPRARALPLRPRRLQARLRARRAGAVDAPPSAGAAGTVHLGGTLEEIAAAEADGRRAARHAARPFVLVAQQSLFDPSRAPAGAHTLWAYCHVPNGSAVDATRARSRRRSSASRPASATSCAPAARMGPAELEAHNANYVGGDINGGAADLRQLFARPVARPCRTRRPTRASSSARRRRRPAAACTGCAGGMPRAQRCAARCADVRPGQATQSCRHATASHADADGAIRGVPGAPPATRPPPARRARDRRRPTGGWPPRSGHSKTTSTSGCCTRTAATRCSSPARTSSACSAARRSRRATGAVASTPRTVRATTPARPSCSRGGPPQVDYRVHGLDGTTRWIRARVNPEQLADGSVRFAGILADVTQQHEARTACGQRS